MRRINSYSSGFTIVELNVVIIMIPIIIALFILALYQISENNSRQSSKLALNDTLQLAVDTIEKDVKLSNSFAEVLPAEFTDPYGIDNSGTPWNFAGTSSTSRALLLSAVATSQNNLTNTRTPIYNGPTSFNCAEQMTYNPLLTYMVIYFVRNQNLYRRTLTSSDTTLCNGPVYQKQSCPPELSATWNAICKARDEKIASNVVTFSIDYYTLQETSPLSTIYSSPDQEDMKTIDDAEITLGLSRGKGNYAASSSQTLRIARLNKL